MVLLQESEFLVRLTELFGLSRSGTVYLGMKRFCGRKAGLLKRKAKLKEEAAAKEEPRCLVRARSNRKKSKISCIVYAKDLVRFQLALGNVMRQQMDGLKTREKTKEERHREREEKAEKRKAKAESEGEKKEEKKEVKKDQPAKKAKKGKK
ncbi:unnamed protein product [Effrenium voratum]|uniref:Signal recognition particle 14 kDa protein n=1 Tax=Effrenium voratum TaxID=2562239 RepID=A0AA36J6J0_9DINO|nr:unnamed protein product [Effrenium voratum]CAJ1399444.1 unnamed protein product [Effrenium voratum]CAJ1447570.1 unnamed protein product [Effrenium voratum]|mmetsp:Transcript_72263/g.172541  ORF Transcript_72263/g.172541 Transcript_72263/m.172541 type:complete len:151 (+) Transcript_72263:64-516(+)